MKRRIVVNRFPFLRHASCDFIRTTEHFLHHLNWHSTIVIFGGYFVPFWRGVTIDFRLVVEDLDAGFDRARIALADRGLQV